MNDEWCFRLSRYSKFLFRRWLTSMFTSVSFWKIAAMLVQSLTTFRGGGLRCVFVDTVHSSRLSVSRISLLWVFLFRPWLTIFLFWNIALTFKPRQVPPRYSGLQSLLSCPHGVVIHARWEDGMEELVWSTMRRMEWWKRHAFKLREAPPRYSGFQSLFSCQHGKLWFVRGGRGWHGGIGMMNDEKDGMVEKACTVWSALGRELRLCLEITKVIRTITESLFSVQA